MVTITAVRTAERMNDERLMDTEVFNEWCEENDVEPSAEALVQFRYECQGDW